MPFVEGKVALITGGASGIGLFTAREFLKNGIKGITVADVHAEGDDVVRKLGAEFGANRVVFIKTDVGKLEEIEGAFRKTVEVFGNVDILVNSAGICADNKPERTIAVNLTGTLNANLLAMDRYLPAHRSGDEGVIINISSLAGLEGTESLPVYAATKHGVLGLGRSLGTENHYKTTKVRVLTICPGATDTSIFNDLETIFVGPRYKELYALMYAGFVFQKSEVVGKGIVKIIEEGPNGSIWVIMEEKIKEVKLPNLADLLRQ